MRFRKLYWVTEQIDTDGTSTVVGVYTSVFDLTSKGLRWDEDTKGRTNFRVSLVQLDAPKAPLGSWEGPGFDGFLEDMRPFVETGEFDTPSLEQLAEDLKAFAPSGVSP